MSANRFQANGGHENVLNFRFQFESNSLKANCKPNFGKFMSANRLKAKRGHENVSNFRFQLELNLLKAT